ncbi:hypothetical protein H4217_001087 [Coemansia sp. RSA 1939]|nr:hypothetical protein H4217_001087 [Coemansia sp. RSA 1939]KAJ2608962.1 hypothetical protein EV177_004701 [Coemansia sp. RSA 1804]
MSSVDPSPYGAFKSLEWIEGVVWDVTGLPDAFASLLSDCSAIARDRSHATQHVAAALEILDIVEPAKSMYDPDGPDALKKAIDAAVVDPAYASMLGNICDTYYFLRALDVFGLDSKSFEGIVALLHPDEHDDTSSIEYTHAEIVAMLNTYLNKLESEYPGIKQYANCIMLEANVVQEFGACHELLYAFRSELPTDGDLYMETLRCVVDCVQENLDMEQLTERTHALYEGSLGEFWPAALNFIWELYNGSDGEYSLYNDSEEYVDVEYATSASGNIGVAKQTVSVAH